MKFGKQLELHRSEMIIAFCAWRISTTESNLFSMFFSWKNFFLLLFTPFFLCFLPHSWKFLLLSTLHTNIMCEKFPKTLFRKNRAQEKQQQLWKSLKTVELDELILTSIIGFVTQEERWECKQRRKRRTYITFIYVIYVICIWLYGLGNILRFQIYWY